MSMVISDAFCEGFQILADVSIGDNTRNVEFEVVKEGKIVYKRM